MSTSADKSQSKSALGELVDTFRDPYEKKARAFPGLLLVLPLLVAVGSTWGTRHPIIAGMVGLLLSCGVVYTLASLVRDWGKQKEEALVVQWGGMPSTIVLRHRDTHLENGTKLAYHQLIKQKLGFRMPTRQEEETDPQAADDAYRTATRALRESTRGKQYALLLKENISYGFRRNMYGARRLGWATSGVGFAVGVLLSGFIKVEPFRIDWKILLELPLPAALTMGVSAALFIVWFFFGPKAVRRAGYAYADRLLETLRSLPTPRGSRARNSEL